MTSTGLHHKGSECVRCAFRPRCSRHKVNRDAAAAYAQPSHCQPGREDAVTPQGTHFHSRRADTHTHTHIPDFPFIIRTIQAGPAGSVEGQLHTRRFMLLLSDYYKKTLKDTLADIERVTSL